MNQVKRLLSLSVVVVGVLAFSAPADAHKVFKNQLSKAYPNMKVTCNTCHVPKEKKTERNSFGMVFAKVINSETMTADWKEKKGAEKKEFEAKEMAPAFDKAFEKIKKMTFNDMVEAGLVDGISPKEEK